VILRPDGSLHSFRQSLAEETPGASLTKGGSRVPRGEILAGEKKLDLKRWTLVESNSDKRPASPRPHADVQQNEPLDPSVGPTAGNADHAYARADVQVLGDEP